eukprot:TRINITY_DN9415_c0_g1_i7.p1 TRINITY_DN9415_c0_g1~~TRINITY_DN9415_c0_g1_i7.p1  ORF type:complete len:514 (-),score=130.30 TRINITY_DN9415_c0_g1_i7:234-1580(-)
MSEEVQIRLPLGDIPPDLPESLAAFVRHAGVLAMNRRPPAREWHLDSFSLPSLGVDMSLKKVHEVKRLAEVLEDVCRSVSCDTVLDVGSGEGYLSQVMHHQCHMHVLALDASESFTAGARKRALRIARERIRREKRDGTGQDRSGPGVGDHGGDEAASGSPSSPVANPFAAMGGPVHVVGCLSPDMTPDDFYSIVGAGMAASGVPCPDDALSSASLGSVRAVMAGLHTCGDLATTMIRLVTSTPSMCALVDVGCCYYRIPSDEDTYTMISERCKALTCSFNAGALKLACEDVHRFTSSSAADHRYDMAVHFYRTILETVMTRLHPRGHPYTVRNMSRKKSAAAASYFEQALARMQRQQQEISRAGGEAPALPTLEDLNSEYAKHEGDFTKVSALLTLRAVLAPVIESLVLLDRWMFLDEHPHITARLVPVFNEDMSPRNIAVLAWKQT